MTRTGTDEERLALLAKIAGEVISKYPEIEFRITPKDAGLLFDIVITGKDNTGRRPHIIQVRRSELGGDDAGIVERRISRAALQTSHVRKNRG